MKHTLTLLLSSLIAVVSYAQDNTESAKPAEKAEKGEAKMETKIEGKSKGPKEKVPYRFMANIHGGIGLMNYFGDLRDNPGTTVHRIGSHPGYNFGIGANVTNYLELNINTMLAKVSWNQNPSLHDIPRNFQAENFSIGANLVYNFHNLIRGTFGITPFIAVGISYSDFDVYTDLKDGDGNTYHYWSDRSIRDQAESNNLNNDAVFIQRDFSYEQKVNQESPIVTFSIPIGGGFDFNVNKNFTLRFGANYYLTGTDKMDNLEGGTNGFFSNDGYIYTHMNLICRFNPFKPKTHKTNESGNAYSEIVEIVYVDSDGDGVSDLEDQCGDTPKGHVVDENGCPADDDGDGIPNYRDKELNTTTGRIVDPNGVAISYQEIYKSHTEDKISIQRKDVSKDWFLFTQKSVDTDYTVHLGTYSNYNIPEKVKVRLARMEDLVENKVNDSISVFSVGKFQTFDEAEKLQNELIKSGIDEAFGLNEQYIAKVGVDLGVSVLNKESNQSRSAAINFENVDVIKYVLELKEYRIRVQLERLSELIGQHGVEIKTTEGGMKIYTIGAFSTFEEAQALQRQVSALGVSNSEIAAKLNNEFIDIEEAKKKQAEMQGEKSE